MPENWTIGKGYEPVIKKADGSLRSPEPGDEVPSLFLSARVSECSDIDEFRSCCQYYSKYTFTWKDKINELLSKTDYKISDIAHLLNVSESTVKRFKNVPPSKRNLVIKIAALFGLSRSQTDELLMKKTGFTRLYSKNPDDLIWIYILDNKLAYQKKPQVVFDELFCICEKSANDSENTVYKNISEGNTAYYDASVRNCKAVKDLCSVYSEVKVCVKKGYCGLLKKISDLISGTGKTANTLFISDPTFYNLHYRITEQLKKQQCPTRTYLIVLGLKLGLDSLHINELLELAGMGALSVKDDVESAIYFGLENLYVYDPDIFYDPDNNDRNALGLRNESESCGAKPCPEQLFLRITQFIEESDIAANGKLTEENIIDYLNRR